MLKRLLIENYILIQRAELFPARGLNVVTGETGAGKSMLLGVLSLLKGEKTPHIIRPKKDKKIIIEAEFSHASDAILGLLSTHDLDTASTVLLRKEITPEGRHRHFLNDSPVSKELLKSAGDCLMEIHAQHQNTALNSQKFQRELLDAYGKLTPYLNKYETAYASYIDAKKRCEEMAKHQEKESTLRALHLAQHSELKSFELVIDEEKTLEKEHAVLTHAQHIRDHLRDILGTMTGNTHALLPQLYGVKRGLEAAQDKMPALQDYTKRIESVYIELEDISEDLRRKEQAVIDNPEKLEEVRKRLHALYALQKKHKLHTAKELLALQAKLEQHIGSKDYEKQLQQAKHVLEKKEQVLLVSGKALSKARKKTATSLAKATKEHLGKLGMPKATFTIEVHTTQALPHGMDVVNFLFTANVGTVACEIRKVASGGELSRLMLVIKYLVGEKDKIPTMIFDEIDTGISGEASYQMLRMVEEIAVHHQVLNITHLPQFARRGDRHFHVYKVEKDGRHQSFIKPIEDQERVEEIAKMVDGNNPREEVITSVRNMMKTPHK